MRTAINVIIILLVGLGIGLALRSWGPEPEPTAVLSDDGPIRPTETGADDQGATGHGLDGPAGPSPGAGNDELAAEGWLTEFELVERSGQEVTSESLRGQPYVASFFFSTCPSICKLQNEKLQQLQKEFEDSAVRFVAISVDPETDTPETLAEYAQRYKADEDQWLFFTGDMTYIRRVGAEMYGVPVDRKLHTEKFILVGPDGKVRGYYKWTDAAQFEKLQEDIRELLDGGTEAA